MTFRTVPIQSLAAYGLGGLMVATCCAYVLAHMSPFPNWDMWDGNVDFLVEFDRTGDLSLLFHQHNEHRLVLTKTLFLLDEYVFSATYYSLYIWQLVFAGLFALLLGRGLVKSAQGPDTAAFSVLLGSFAFFLVQHDNFDWAFQSQFILAYLVPFAAYCFWAKYLQESKKLYLGLAIGLMILSAGTMANGALVVIPVVLYALIRRSSWRSIVGLCGLQALILVAYLYDYHAPGGHGSIQSTLLENPINTILFFLTYIGSLGGKYYAVAFGLFMIGIIGAALTMQLAGKRDTAPHAALILLPLYVFMTAALTAFGRANFGLEAALTSRYTTPSVYAFLCVVALLYLWVPKIRTTLFNGLLAFAAIALVVQFVMLHDTDKHLAEFKRRAATISLLQATPDIVAFNAYSYPWTMKTGSVVAARYHQVTLLGQEPYSKLDHLLGAAYPVPDALPNCDGGIDAMDPLPETQALKVDGWFLNDRPQKYHLLRIVQNDRVVGFGTTGGYRGDVVKKTGTAKAYSGFWAYPSLQHYSEGPFAIMAYDGSFGCVFEP